MIVYTTLDPEGQTVTLVPGAPFTTYTLNGEPCELNHPWTALDSYTAADLARFGITATTEPDPPAPVPAMISRMQAQLELQSIASPTNAGKTLLDDVNAALGAAGDPTIAIYWNTASEFHRDHPKLAAMASAMGWSSSYLDSLFVAAAQLS